MKIVRNAPKLELTEREYHLLDEAYALIAAINNNLTNEDWNYLNSYFHGSLTDVRDTIGVLMDWSKTDAISFS